MSHRISLLLLFLLFLLFFLLFLLFLFFFSRICLEINQTAHLLEPLLGPQLLCRFGIIHVNYLEYVDPFLGVIHAVHYIYIV